MTVIMFWDRRFALIINIQDGFWQHVGSTYYCVYNLKHEMQTKQIQCYYFNINIVFFSFLPSQYTKKKKKKNINVYRKFSSLYQSTNYVSSTSLQVIAVIVRTRFPVKCRQSYNTYALKNTLPEISNECTSDGRVIDSNVLKNTGDGSQRVG